MGKLGIGYRGRMKVPKVGILPINRNREKIMLHSFLMKAYRVYLDKYVITPS